MNRPKERGKLKTLTENEIIRRREKQYQYDQMWNGAVRYFQHWDKTNTKYDAWTSPRYYEDNNRLMSEIRMKRDKEDLLLRRREKLRKLLDEEQSSYEIEQMVLKHKNIETPSTATEDPPTDMLKDIDNELKMKEKARRKHEAELKLYHQWRKNNPIVRQYESKYRCKDLKLSWLDQQIEKRMQKEREEEEAKRLLKEHEARMKEDQEKEKQFNRYLEEKRAQLKQNLEKQIDELKYKKEISDKLKQQEDEEMKKSSMLADLEDLYRSEEKRRADRECALFNIRQHKMKLKQKVLDINENLEQEKLMVEKIKKLELENIIDDELKKKELKEGLSEFLDIIKQQQELEKQKQKHLEFLFDSEVKAIYDKQAEIWKREEVARQNLLKKVLRTVDNQIQDNLQRNKEKQKQVLLEREEMLNTIEEYKKELLQLKDEEERRKVGFKKVLDDEITIKKLRKKQDENIKLKEINEELDRIAKEEERLQQEILKMQRKRGPITPIRTNRLFF